MSKLSKEEAKQALESFRRLPDSPWWDDVRDAIEVAIEALSEPKEPEPAELIPDHRHKGVWCEFSSLKIHSLLKAVEPHGEFYDWGGDYWKEAVISPQPVPVAKLPNPGYQPVPDDVLCLVFFSGGGKEVGFSVDIEWSDDSHYAIPTHYIPLDVRETD